MHFEDCTEFALLCKLLPHSAKRYNMQSHGDHTFSSFISNLKSYHFEQHSSTCQRDAILGKKHLNHISLNVLLPKMSKDNIYVIIMHEEYYIFTELL